MKHIVEISVILAIAVLVLGFSSCRGSAGKKAATEALEYMERKGGSLLEKEGASILERQGGRLAEEEETAAERAWKNKRRADRVQEFLDGSDDEEETQYQPQPTAVLCSQCGGSGAVYILDMYGNPVFDMYGNPQISPCPVCSGNGQVIVYQ
jgi:DnaJ-class molecular chaperone